MPFWMNALRRLAAVIAGLLTVVLPAVLTDEIMHATGLMARAKVLSTNEALLALAYRSLFTVLGGWVAGKLAPCHPMRPVWVLAFIGFVAGLAGALGTPGYGPDWYKWSLAIEAIPLVWLGGRLAMRFGKREWQDRSTSAGFGSTQLPSPPPM